MRNLEAIETELTAAREALSSVKGTPAEVYSRIVGYYRSVRNWNKGKREEYGERVLFKPDASLLESCAPQTPLRKTNAAAAPAEAAWNAAAAEGERVLLFVQPACPACPSAKAAAGKLGVPLELVDAATGEGLAEAVRRNVLSTPTAILLSSAGKELGRALNAGAIGRLLENVPEAAAV